MIYFISDFHFGHKKIIEFERWNFRDIQEHDEKIMNMLEECICDNDILYFLGDLGWPNDDIIKRFNNLKCKKFMIVGNHDTKTFEYYKTKLSFDEIYEYPIWLSDRIVISHHPIPVEEGVVNIHGHLHGSYLEFTNYVNVNVHMLDYKLCSQKQINGLLARLPKPSTKFLKEWFTGHQIYTDEQMERKSDVIFDKDGRAIGFK